MVLRDIFSKENSQRLELRPTDSSQKPLPLADPLNRWSALVVDTVILMPLISLLLAGVKRRQDVAQWLNNDLDVEKYLFIYIALSLLIILAYQTISIALLGATPGKLFFGLRVVSIWDRTKPGWGSSFTRALYWCLGGITMFFPHLGIFYHRQRRPIYDRLADTIVLCQEKFAVGPPNVHWTGMLKGLLSAFYMFVFTMLVVNGMEYLRNPKELSQSSLKSSTSFCHVITSTIPTSKVHDHQARLTHSLELFASNLLDEDCLDREADNALWSSKPTQQAYTAKALVFLNEPTVFQKYKRKVCQLNAKSDYCLLLKAKEKDHVSPPTRLNGFYQKLSESDYIEVRLWAVNHWMKTYDYAKALKIIDGLESKSHLSPFLGLQKLKALWGSNQLDLARTALYTYLPNVGMQTALLASSWFCYEETLQSCSPEQRKACAWFEKTLDAFEIKNLTPFIALPLARNNECKPNSMADYKGLLKKIEDQETQSVIKYMIKPSKEQTAKLWRTLFLDSVYQADAKLEVALRWLAQSDDPKDLQALKTAWDKEKWKLGEHGFTLASQLFTKLHQNGLHNDAYDVGKFVVPHNRSNSLAQQWIISAFKAGQHKQAWQAYLNLGAQLNQDRLPASVDYQTAVQELKKRFSKK